MIDIYNHLKQAHILNMSNFEIRQDFFSSFLSNNWFAPKKWFQMFFSRDGFGAEKFFHTFVAEYDSKVIQGVSFISNSVFFYY